MAKKPKSKQQPQFDWRDLLKYLGAAAGTNVSQQPVSAPAAQGLGANRAAADIWSAMYDPKNFGKEGNITNPLYEWGTPAGLFLDAPEMRRLATQGPDKGIAASAALGLALMGGGKLAGTGGKKALSNLKMFQRLLEESGMGSPKTAPMRAAANEYTTMNRAIRS